MKRSLNKIAVFWGGAIVESVLRLSISSGEDLSVWCIARHAAG